ncbi:hypothetical protein [Sphingomonas sp. PR090111-T3T-6A]|uniref:hypothetical protein n=1 Tax=Sphingomonas sp. PR090111-T3T-6A TaxID=685778 RepID=UPI00035CD554|nr:hypothetical protein [Sphingomonas sp. PR090111-T3T-6A]
MNMLRSQSFEGLPRIRLPIAPFPDESLVGLIFRAASENMHGNTSLIWTAAGYPTVYSYANSVHHETCLPKLEYILGQHPGSLRRLTHPLIAKGQLRADFFGARVSESDIVLKRRRFSPAALRINAYHRSLWAHALVPFCTETWEYLLDSCPQCGRNLSWYMASGMTACACEFDLRNACASLVERAQRPNAGLMANLLAPNSAARGTAMMSLPEPLREMNCGEIFELGWGAGSLLANLPRRTGHKQLLPASIVKVLDLGGSLLRDWPCSLRHQLASLATASDAARFDRFMARLRTKLSGEFVPSEIRRAWRNALPSRQLSALEIRRDLDSAKITAGEVVNLGIKCNAIPKLVRAGVLTTSGRSDTKSKIFAVYDRHEVTFIRKLFDDRLPFDALSHQLGATGYAVEQLICLKEIEELDHLAVKITYPRLHVSQRSADAFMARLRSRAITFGTSEPTIALARAMTCIGGRLKPWGPALGALAAGEIAFTVRERPGQFAQNASIRLADVERLRKLTFDEGDYPDFAFSKRLLRQEVEGVLNLTPVGMQRAIRARDLVPLPTSTDHDLKSVLGRAQRIISSTEIGVRWFRGENFRASQLRRHLQPLSFGFDRGATEQYFG